MGCDDNWPAMLSSVVVLSFSFSEAEHTTMHHDVQDETGSAGRMSRLVTVPTDPFTRPTAPILSEWAKCQPRSIQNVGPYFRSRIWWQILNREARVSI